MRIHEARVIMGENVIKSECTLQACSQTLKQEICAGEDKVRWRALSQRLV